MKRESIICSIRGVNDPPPPQVQTHTPGVTKSSPPDDFYLPVDNRETILEQLGGHIFPERELPVLYPANGSVVLEGPRRRGWGGSEREARQKRRQSDVREKTNKR